MFSFFKKKPQPDTVAPPAPASEPAAVVPPASHDHGPWHLDLGSTPPDDDVTPGATFSTVVERADTSGVSHESVAAVGRAPPAL